MLRETLILEVDGEKNTLRLGERLSKQQVHEFLNEFLMAAQPLRRVFAIIPACGASRRMGISKLLLDLGGRTLIRRLINSLNVSQIAAVCVLVRADDQKLRDELNTCGDVEVVIADPTPSDMKESVQQLLESISTKWTPTDRDAWLLIPGDHPIVESSVMERLLEESRKHADQIVVPIHQRRRGHPTVFPWRLTSEVFQLPDDQGVNALLHGAEKVVEVPCPEPSVLWDIDTPEDYAAICSQFDEPRAHFE